MNYTIAIVEDDIDYQKTLITQIEKVGKSSKNKFEIITFNSYYLFFDYYYKNLNSLDLIISDHFLGQNLRDTGIDLIAKVLNEVPKPSLLITGKEDFGTICASLYENTDPFYHSYIGYLHKSLIVDTIFEEKLLKLLVKAEEYYEIKQHGVGKARLKILPNSVNYIEVKPNSRSHKMVFSIYNNEVQEIVVSRKSSEDFRNHHDHFSRVKFGDKFYYINQNNIEKQMVSYISFKDGSILK